MTAIGSTSSGTVLFGLDAHGIQRYLFATAKLREIVGASQLVADLTDGWVRETLAHLAIQPRSRGGDAWYEPVRLGGGSVRLVLSTADVAPMLLGAIRRRAICEAPGLSFDAAWVPYDAAGGDLAEANRLLIARINADRNHPRDGGGFKGFPISAPCRMTFEPAAGFGQDRNERLCGASLAKRRAQAHGRGDWRYFVADHPLVQARAQADDPFETELNEIANGDADNGYVAVACLDLNDLGKRGQEETSGRVGFAASEAFYRFTEHVKRATKAAFHSGLDAIASDALAAATLAANQPPRRLPLRPLVIGGDDMTFVMDARLAAPFVLGMLRSFEADGFHGGAGIAFVKAKSPFGRAVGVAEDLVAMSKAKGRTTSHVDFMTCAGEVPADVRDARMAALTSEARLTAGPWTLDGFSALVRKAATLARLPRGHVRGAADRCHEGVEEGHRAFVDLRENLARGLGGRPDGDRGLPVTEPDLLAMYPDGFFTRSADGSVTDLLDCIDLFRFVTTPAVPTNRRPREARS
jgi:hypothetical protein